MCVCPTWIRITREYTRGGEDRNTVRSVAISRRALNFTRSSPVGFRSRLLCARASDKSHDDESHRLWSCDKRGRSQYRKTNRNRIALYSLFATNRIASRVEGNTFLAEDTCPPPTHTSTLSRVCVCKFITLLSKENYNVEFIILKTSSIVTRELAYGEELWRFQSTQQ